MSPPPPVWQVAQCAIREAADVEDACRRLHRARVWASVVAWGEPSGSREWQRMARWLDTFSHGFDAALVLVDKESTP